MAGEEGGSFPYTNKVPCFTPGLALVYVTLLKAEFQGRFYGQIENASITATGTISPDKKVLILPTAVTGLSLVARCKLY